MVHFLFRCFVLLVILGAGSCSQAPEEKASSQKIALNINARVFTSPLGRTFWFVQDQKTPRIVVAASYRGGYALEGDQEAGLHLFYSDVVTKGAGPWSEKSWNEKLNENGASFRVSVDEDRVKIHAVMLRKYWRDVLPVMEAVFHQPRFDQESIDTTRNQLIAIHRQLTHDPDYMIAETLYKTYLNHPYMRHPLRNLKFLQNATRADLLALHKKILARPLTVTLVGNVTVDEAGEVVDKLFPHVRSIDSIQVPPLKPHDIAVETAIPAKVKQATVVALHKGTRIKNKDNVGLAIVARILDRRIFEDVREERGLAYTISTNRVSYLYGGYIECRGGTTAKEAQKVTSLIRHHWKSMAHDGPTDKELNDAVNFAVNYLTMLPDSITIAQRLETIQFQGKPASHIHTVLDEFRNLRLADVKRIAQKYLKPDQLKFFIHGVELTQSGQK